MIDRQQSLFRICAPSGGVSDNNMMERRQTGQFEIVSKLNKLCTFHLNNPESIFDKAKVHKEQFALSLLVKISCYAAIINGCPLNVKNCWFA